MNRGMLKHKLGLADVLDDYIVKHQRLKGCKPERIFITAEQREQLDAAAIPTARLKDWCGVPLEVRG